MANSINDQSSQCTKLINSNLRKIRQAMKKKFAERFVPQHEPTNTHVCTNIKEALNETQKKMSEIYELEKKILVIMDTEKPKFSTPEHMHPLNFVENLTAYLEKIPATYRTVETAIDCLYGDAKNWATVIKPQWENVDDLKRDFLQQYWGNAEQSMLRKQIVTGTWNRQTETMSRHFMCLVSQAKWLTHQITDEELVYEIMHHFPKPVQVAWCVSKKSTILEATEFLRKMDDIEIHCEGKKRRRQRQSQLKKYAIELKWEKHSTAANVESEEKEELGVANESQNDKKFQPEECIDLCFDS